MDGITGKDYEMDQAVVADTKPVVLDLKPGTYWWCACGRSKNQPWCDGSHKGTGITPVSTPVEKPKKAAMCLCKKTGNAPYCDGTHSKLK